MKPDTNMQPYEWVLVVTATVISIMFIIGMLASTALP